MTHSDPETDRTETDGGFIGAILDAAHREAQEVCGLDVPADVRIVTALLYDRCRTEVLGDSLAAYDKIVAEWPGEMTAIHAYLIAQGIGRALRHNEDALLALLAAALDALHSEQAQTASEERRLGQREVVSFVEGWISEPHPVAHGGTTAAALLAALRQQYDAEAAS